MASNAGVTRILTEYEVIDKGSAQYRRLQQEAEKLTDDLSKLEKQEDKTGKGADALSRRLGNTNNALRLLPGPLGNVASALGGDKGLAKALGISSGAMTKLGQAGAIAGAAIAGWKVGRWISDITGLSAAVADATGSIEELRNEAELLQSTMDLLSKAGDKFDRKFGNLKQLGQFQSALFKERQAALDELAAAEASLGETVQAAGDQVEKELAAIRTAETAAREEAAQAATDAAAESVKEIDELIAKSTADGVARGVDEGLTGPEAQESAKKVGENVGVAVEKSLTEQLANFSRTLLTISGGEAGPEVAALFEEFAGQAGSTLSPNRLAFLKNLGGEGSLAAAETALSIFEQEQRVVKKFGRPSAGGSRSFGQNLEAQFLRELVETLKALQSQRAGVAIDEASITKLAGAIHRETRIGR